MKIRNMFSVSCCLLLAGFLLLCTGLTGCADREAEFLTADSSDQGSPRAGSDEAPAGESKALEGAGAVSPPAEGTPAVRPGQEAPGGLQEKTEIYVDVCGAVAHPGVYTLASGSRVFQAIEAAGGYLPEAADGYVNRAQGLEDGQQVYIPTQEEVKDRPPGIPAQSLPAEAGTAAGDPAEAGDGKVNLNTADESRLTTLTGIGESKARAIIAYREENGPFSAVEDIMNVQGIKEGTFAKIKDDISVG